MALKLGSPTTSSGDRLRAAGEAGLLGEEDLGRLLEAQELILELVLRQQIADLAAGRDPGSRVDPDGLSRRNREGLKAALKHLDLLPDMVQAVLTGAKSS